MAIAKNPKRNLELKSEAEIQEFISKAGQPRDIEPEAADERENKKPIMVRIDPDMLKRIDQGARRLGISRSAFIVSSAAEKLERMG
jgi:hypothetical protein